MVPLADIQEATHRLVRTVDDMSDDEYVAPSFLPGWSRAHVVAHLALNAEALAGALSGVELGRPVPMYSSQEARDTDIAELVTASPRELRTRLLGATAEFAAAVTAVPEHAWGTQIERTPGGPTFVAGAVPGMREREVEIHHADLLLAYTPKAWPPEFCARLLEAMSKRKPASSFSVHATDLDRTWQCGDGAGGPLVRGTAADLGWWLSGRGDGEGLSCNDGELPEVESW